MEVVVNSSMSTQPLSQPCLQKNSSSGEKKMDDDFIIYPQNKEISMANSSSILEESTIGSKTGLIRQLLPDNIIDGTVDTTSTLAPTENLSNNFSTDSNSNGESTTNSTLLASNIQTDLLTSTHSAVGKIGITADHNNDLNYGKEQIENVTSDQKSAAISERILELYNNVCSNASAQASHDLKVVLPPKETLISEENDQKLEISTSLNHHEVSIPSSSTSNPEIYESKHTPLTIHQNNEGTISKIPEPMTPLGQVVESGQEHTGRWTREEHDAFLNALQKYGKNWKKVAARVKTRTVVQTRTHAQKYFQKLQKLKTSTGTMSGKDAAMLNLVGGSKEDGSGSEESDNNNGNPDVKPKGRKRAKVTENISGSYDLVSTSMYPRGRRASSTPINSYTSPEVVKRKSKEACPVTKAAAALMSKLAAATLDKNPSSATTLITLDKPKLGNDDNKLPKPSPSIATHSKEPNTSTKILPEKPTSSYPPQIKSLGTIKIKAPTPEQIRRAGFPEPSPAACGKRKIEELNAAQMLADVMSKPPFLPIPNQQKLTIPTKPTPTIHAKLPQNIKSSLHIVNPDILGVHVPSTAIGKRQRESGLSTPWDGQLEALVKRKQDNNDDERQGFSLSYPKSSDSNYENKSENDSSDELMFHPLHGLNNNAIPSSSSLHNAICSGSVDEVTKILETMDLAAYHASMKDFTKIDIMGFSPLHVASTIEDQKAALDIIRILLSSLFDPKYADAMGNTPLFWAARSGNDQVVHLLALRNCPLDAQNKDGETALHWAMRAGRKGLSSVRVLIENGARPSIFNHIFRRPIDVACFGFKFLTSWRRIVANNTNSFQSHKKRYLEEDDDSKTDVQEEIREARYNLLSFSAQSRTLVLHHPECLEHIPKNETDWEVPDRIISILNRIEPREIQQYGALDAGKIFFHQHEITISTEFERASLELLSRVHSTEYLAFVNDLSKELEQKLSSAGGCAKDKSDPSYSSDHASVLPFTPIVQKKIRKIETVKHGKHSDTSFSVGSLRAARRAAGSVQHAVDCVLTGRNRNAFCIVRPPGHHAGYEGLLENGESCGFCIFNNVAAGAAHALSEHHRPRCQRCAIVDIDVHHGNGTQEIVQSFHDPTRLFFFSVHLYDKDCGNIKKKGPTHSPSTSYFASDDRCSACVWQFYPGTGASDDVAMNVVNVPIAPLWKEKDLQNTFKLSSLPQNQALESSGSSPRHNTRHQQKLKAAAAKGKTNAPQDASEISSQTSSSDSTLEKFQENQTSADAKPPLPSSPSSPATPSQYLMGIGRKAYRRAIKHRLIPALRAFNPDLILISAGFDAAREDVGNAKHFAGKKEKMGIDLEPEDYAWTTQKIMEVADICCQGRVVSVLEGGYGRTPSAPNENDKKKVRLLDKTIFSECAAQHLWSCVDPYNVEKRVQ